MSNSSVNRLVRNPRMRTSSKTLVPDDDYDDPPYYLGTRENFRDPINWKNSWEKPISIENRTVTPVLRNSGGSLLMNNRPLIEEDPYSPWK